ncbi:phosphoglucomutase/phosphomannomutase family protein [Anaerocolumna sp.]|uniref:phosphoglucomutase/phosphomannomutase family protein n=1 Tax=Anaerocolumna sp. TaxID=2041569 RepID=UPI0028AD6D49|nr:phosphoglucomutase/phosphomannomutase family protein [Anaerocolumna sp.]
MIKFGTGGWRALIGEEFTKDNVRILSQAVANMIISEQAEEYEFVIGYDRRFLSDKAAKWMSEVLAGNGIKVIFIEKIAPTPLVMFTVQMQQSKFGAAITASHNPADYNGIKIFTEGGKDATETVTEKIEEFIEEVDKKDIKSMEFNLGIEKGRIIKSDPMNTYIDSIISMIDIDAIRKKHLKILLDPMFGVSKTSLQTVLITARCDVDIINDRHDTLFGGRLPSPSLETLQRLRSTVMESGYDLGIGTDGDADRLGIIDSNGEFIHPNSILVLLYYYLLKYKGLKGCAVRNLTTTHLLDKIADKFGEKCYEVPVGFKYICSKMEEQDAIIGGESSGGLSIKGHIKGKDGIFAASLLVEMISVTGKSLTELLQELYIEFGYCYMAENAFVFQEEIKDRLQKLLFQEKKLPEFTYDVEKVSYMDGVKVYFTNGGWISARFSGTEPLLRIFAEMESELLAKEVSDDMRNFLSL